jgi:hypothetical protein
MSEEPPENHLLAEDLAVLGLDPGASLADIQREYRHRHGLYSPESLAAYGLIDDSERAERLDAVEAAYRRLLSAHQQHRPQIPDFGASRASAAKVETTVEPDTHPGQYLREVREARRISIDDLSAETKIRHLVIEQLEDERYLDLPQPVFVRGFVVQIARAISAPNPEDLAKTFITLMQDAKDG